MIVLAVLGFAAFVLLAALAVALLDMLDDDRP